MSRSLTAEALGASFVGKALKHYGTKGMKWGVRKKEPKAPPSTDKVTADAAKAKAKQSGTAALSNKELRDASERARLEQDYDRLVNGKTANKGSKIAKEILSNIAKKQATNLGNELVSNQIKKARNK